jgi:hypothetical protein
MEGPILEHANTKDFVDPASALTYDPMLGLDYVNASPPFAVSTLGLQQTASPRMSFEALNMPISDYGFSPQPSYISSPPVRPFTPTENGIYTATLNNVSAGELSSDSMRQGSPSFVLRHIRRNSGTVSPLSSSSGLASVPRSAHRYNPIGVSPAVAARRERKPRSRKSEDFASDDEEEVDYPPPTTAAGTEARREEIRRQRIESEQRRRDELRDGYRRLKDALPVSNQKSSKVCLLDRATTHIKYLEMTTQQLQSRVQQAEAEVQRLRQFNEALMLGTAESRHAAATASAAAAAAQASNNF